MIVRLLAKLIKSMLQLSLSSYSYDIFHVTHGFLMHLCICRTSHENLTNVSSSVFSNVIIDKHYIHTYLYFRHEHEHHYISPI
jgi:hypothetical protein